MVTDLTGPSGSMGDDRAQLLLLGAIGVAVVVVGLTVAVNSTLIVEDSATSDSIHGADDAASFDAEAVRNVRTVVLRLNHGPRERTGERLAENVSVGLGNYSQVLTRSVVRSEGAWVNVSYDNDSSEWGSRVVQPDDAQFDAPADPATPYADDARWQPVEDADVGRFVLNLNLSAMDEEAATIRIANETGAYLDVELSKPDEDSLAVEVSGERSGFGSDTAVDDCEAVRGAKSRDRVLLELKTGTVFGGDCRVPAIRNASDESRTLDPPYNVSVRDGDNLVGKFSIVTNETDVPFKGGFAETSEYGYADCAGADATEFCSAPAVWTANVTVDYQSDRVDYTADHNVSVYP